MERRQAAFFAPQNGSKSKSSADLLFKVRGSNLTHFVPAV